MTTVFSDLLLSLGLCPDCSGVFALSPSEPVAVCEQGWVYLSHAPNPFLHLASHPSIPPLSPTHPANIPQGPVYTRHKIPPWRGN